MKTDLIYNSRYVGIYQAEVRHLSHAYILLIMRLFEVVIPVNIKLRYATCLMHKFC